jgi:putative phosphoribosyl transferase
MMFQDRIEAGYALADKLKKYENVNGVVLAVPKGGVPIGYVVAKELGLPLEIILTKKIGHPTNKEYAIGAASLWGSFVIPHEEVSQKYINHEIDRIQTYLKELQQKLVTGRESENLENKILIVIDDGIATGNTLMATINILKKLKPAKIIIAVPVSSKSAFEKISHYVDELVVLFIPQYFEGVGAYYENFEDVNEDEALEYLNKINV